MDYDDDKISTCSIYIYIYIYSRSIECCLSADGWTI